MNTGQKIYLLVGSMVLIVVAMIVGVVKPLFLDIKKTAVSAEESRDKLLSFETIDKNYLQQIEIETASFSDNLELVKSQLIDKAEAVKFFEAMELIASSTGNEIEINASDFPTLTLNLKGTFSNFMKFLGLLENGNFFINVNSIGLTKASGTGISETVSSNEIRADLKIIVYIKK
jgi:hypothetical protein